MNSLFDILGQNHERNEKRNKETLTEMSIFTWSLSALFSLLPQRERRAKNSRVMTHTTAIRAAFLIGHCLMIGAQITT